MNLFALSFVRLEMKGKDRTEIYKFIPIGFEQAKGNHTAEEIPTGNVGTVVEINSPHSKYKTPFMIVGANQFRSLTMDELQKYIEQKAGYSVPDRS